MAGASKNSRTSVTTHKFICNCGGEIITPPDVPCLS